MANRYQPKTIRTLETSDPCTNQPGQNAKPVLLHKPIDQIEPNPRDARVYSRAETRRATKFAQKFGPLPIIVTPDMVPLSDNIWLAAAKNAEFSEIPVIVWPGLTQAEADVFMLAQVRLIERGTWDEKKLGEILRDLTLQDLDFDITLSGFDVAEMDLRIWPPKARRKRPGLSTNWHRTGQALAGQVTFGLWASIVCCTETLEPPKLPTAHAWHARRHRVHRRAVQC